MNEQHIAVLDVGKSNVKLALVDLETQTERAVFTQPNTVLNHGPYPHVDLEAQWAFFVAALKQMHQQYRVDGISVTTHGAAAVWLDQRGELAMPLLDYEHRGPEQSALAYDALRPDFSLTGSPRLPLGLNLGAQLHWLLQRDPDLLRRCTQLVTYPQYWGYRLTGVPSTDVTSLGCHTDLWLPHKQQFSPLVERLGLADKMPYPRDCASVLGPVLPEWARATGLAPNTPVLCGLHDSNASLLPHLLQQHGVFSVVSTGTWVVAMAVGGKAPVLDPQRDTLINVNALGQPVPSARFMGGREFELMRQHSVEAQPTAHDKRAVLAGQVMLLPSVVPGSGPFPQGQSRWTQTPANAGQRAYAVSLYLAMMTEVCLRLVGASGLCIVEGPFTRNSAFLDMLASVRQQPVALAGSQTGTSLGAALLFQCQTASVSRGAKLGAEALAWPTPDEYAALRAYAERWQVLTSAPSVPV